MSDLKLQSSNSVTRVRVGIAAFALVIIISALWSLRNLTTKVTVLTWDGHPIRRAYVVYGFQERDLNVIQSRETNYRGSITETDDDGKAVIRMKGWNDFLMPLLHRGAGRTLTLRCIYTPELHNASSPNWQGDFETYRVVGGTVYLKDLSDNPDGWSRSLEIVEEEIEKEIVHPEEPRERIMARRFSH
jgi:hypothetical protein